jgi:hypothetical protein
MAACVNVSDLLERRLKLVDQSDVAAHTCNPRVAEKGGSRFAASPGKVSIRPYLKNKLKVKRLGV